MKIKKMNDEECLKTFIDMLETRVAMNTAFVRDEETGNITHQVVQLVCGEFSSFTQPQPLANPLRLATAEEQGATVN